jgi:hypothetical protein
MLVAEGTLAELLISLFEMAEHEGHGKGAGLT